MVREGHLVVGQIMVRDIVQIIDVDRNWTRRESREVGQDMMAIWHNI